jgi:DNA-binding NarL/FixJ family response regulator
MNVSSKAAKVSILVADDHELVRRGISSLLAGRRGWKVCAEADNGEEALGHAARLRPDIAILDVSMPGMDGLVTARRIREVSPKTRVMLLTLHDSPEVLQSLLRAGAQGYVLKSDAGNVLIEAVEMLLAGHQFFSPGVVKMLAELPILGGAAPASQPVHFTGREQEVGELLARGMTSKEIADTLSISPRTVEVYRSKLMLKLNAKSHGELVRVLVQRRMATKGSFGD